MSLFSINDIKENDVRQAEVRKGIINLAKNGSSPAQTEAMKMIKNAKLDDL